MFRQNSPWHRECCLFCPVAQQWSALCAGCCLYSQWQGCHRCGNALLIKKEFYMRAFNGVSVHIYIYVKMCRPCRTSCPSPAWDSGRGWPVTWTGLTLLQQASQAAMPMLSKHIPLHISTLYKDSELHSAQKSAWIVLWGKCTYRNPFALIYIFLMTCIWRAKIAFFSQV